MSKANQFREIFSLALMKYIEICALREIDRNTVEIKIFLLYFARLVCHSFSGDKKSIISEPQGFRINSATQFPISNF